MTDSAELGGLLERVRAAEGVDREIDCLLHEGFRPDLGYTSAMRGTYYGEATGEYFGVVEGRQDVVGVAPRYTSSLDAAIGLVERVKPGWVVYIEGAGAVWQARVEVPSPDLEWFGGVGATSALALIAALLASLQGDQPHG